MKIEREKTRVELPIVIEHETIEEYDDIIRKVEAAIFKIEGVIEVEQSIGYEVES